ncbi:MAG: methionyl-tRNA formyltransferase [Gammaproteobacteria bacterium]|nr:methionyl-tRNA formyltransferase [Gammaproteobacteria bacterium]
MTLRVAFAGTPEFALPALTALRAHHQVVGVLTRPDRPSGRGRRVSASAVKEAALAGEVPLAQPATLHGEAAYAQLAAWHPEVLVVVAYGLLLPPEILALPPHGCLNIHASLLPRWRGAAPIVRALLAGDSCTGVTIMQLDSGLDTGPILLQRPLEILRTHTGGALRAALADLGAQALLEALAGIAAGVLSPTPQPREGATYAARITKAEAVIDWKRPAIEIERQVRAFNPEPVAETRLDGEQLRIYEATAIGDETVSKSTETGAIVEVRDESMMIRCGAGLLAVTRVQRPGRRPVSVSDLSHSLALAGRRLG